MDNYEISLWEDYQVTSDGGSYFDERKLCVIGSDSMTAQACAIEPTLTENINGTHTFTFKMFYTYTDTITGEKYENPFSKLLTNERKIKVKWKNKWYDFVIKNIDEDSAGKSTTYTCTDLFINELGKNGYNLIFDTELENNIGTAGELVQKVLENTTWRYDTSSDELIQKIKEAVYKKTTQSSFNAIKQSADGDTTVSIPSGKDILVYYSQISKLLDMKNNETRQTECQFLYSADPYKTEYNDMLVVNGECYVVEFNWRRSGDQFTASINNQNIITIDLANGVSNEYQAERLVKSQISEYDQLLDRFVNLYKDSDENDIYGLQTIEYSDPQIVINLIVNPNNFVNTQGWIPATGVETPIFKAWPEYNSQTSIGSYVAKSYLKIYTGNIDNRLFESNIGYFTPNSADIKNGDIKGIQIGDKYIFRFKAIENRNDSSGKSIDPSTLDYIKASGKITPSITDGTDQYFNIGTPVWNDRDEWLEYTLTCNKSCSVNDIKNLKLRLTLSAVCWVENIEFFKYVEGAPSYDSDERVRIDPGQVDLSSIVNTYYKYYPKDHAGAQKIEDLVYLYSSTENTDLYTPVYNNYEKINTISIKESNRFNILQEIAETFQCWIYFNIEHDETGKIQIDEDGLPKKYVRIVKEIGDRTGFCFEYGIDLKSISRQVNSDSIATKVIIPSNTNEFGKNGFCSIARSRENYSKENFIINLEYYANQGIIDREQIQRDLYSKDDEHYIGYYYHLYEINEQYDINTDILAQKQLELVKQQSQQTVYDQYIKAAIEQLGSNESDMCELAGVDTFEQANQYAKDHANNDKVQALMNAHAQTQQKIIEYTDLLDNINTAVSGLENYIASLKEDQEEYLEDLNELHNAFNKKYANYLFEGTWKDDSFVDDDKYYLAGLEVAYTSSRPQVQYTFDVLRLSSLEEFSSKIFNLGDICYVQDREFFGYVDKFTPYKEEVLISELISYFDTPEKDVIKVQNYRTQFDDLFSRITAATQSLEYSQGQFTRAAEQINPDNTLQFDLLQDTFDKNKNLVLSASNQNVAWDNTGITVTDSVNVGNKLRVMAGGVFVTNDGGNTWKNAIRGDGISTDLLTAGRINTSDIYVYDGSSPAFRWDNKGIIAYSHSLVNIEPDEPLLLSVNNEVEQIDRPNFSKYVRFSEFGIYGYNANEEVIHETEQQIWDDENCKFGLTWKGFFLRGGADDGANLTIQNIGNELTFELSGGSGDSTLSMSADNESASFKLESKTGNNSVEISTDNDILVKTGNINRVKIGRLNTQGTDYGIQIKDNQGANIFSVSANGDDTIGGWNLDQNSFYHRSGTNEIGFYSQGKAATVQGHQGNFNILAGNNFGVTTDGHIYANAGKIAGWNINSDSLTNSTIKISGGEISCTLSGHTSPSWYIKNDGSSSFDNIIIEGGALRLGPKPGGGYMAEITEQGIGKFEDIVITGNNSSFTMGNVQITNQTLYTTNLQATGGGSIGGWSIGTGFLSGGGISMYSSGKLEAGSVKIEEDTLTVNGVPITGYSGGGLSIGGFTYINGSLSASNKLGAVNGINIGDTELDEDDFERVVLLGNNSYTDGLTNSAYLSWLHTNLGNHLGTNSASVTCNTSFDTGGNALLSTGINIHGGGFQFTGGSINNAQLNVLEDWLTSGSGAGPIAVFG